MATATTAFEPTVKISATKLLINGKWVDTASGKTFATINPSTGEEIARVAEADAADVDKAVGGARRLREGPVAQDVRVRAQAIDQPAGRPDREARRRTGAAGVARQRQAVFRRQEPPTCR